MRILHLSDLHFGMTSPSQKSGSNANTSQESAHMFTRDGVPDSKALIDVLKNDQLLTVPRLGSLDLIVVSGDLGWAGSAQDYKYGLEFLYQLKSEFNDTKVAIVPGNHDFDRSAASTGHQPKQAFVDMAKSFYEEAFVSCFPLIQHTEHERERYRFVCVQYLADQYLVVGVNSVSGSNAKGEPVFVDPRALTQVSQYIEQLGVSEDTLRVFVVHHHLFPFAEPDWGATASTNEVPDTADPSIVANSAKLQGWLAANKFGLVLHGHKHMAHSRQDTLWRPDDPAGTVRNIVVVGAGSAGVNQHHRKEELSYNVIDATRGADSRWHFSVTLRKIVRPYGTFLADTWHEFQANSGAATDTHPLFVSEYMDDCHKLISRDAPRGAKLRNFVSIVNSHEFRCPATARIGSLAASEKQIRSSFRTLHPEYDDAKRWSDQKRVDLAIENLPTRFQFQHGPRLFGVLGRAGRRLRGINTPELFQPIRVAVESLSGSESRAYVGLYSSELDVGVRDEPLPGLVGIQFVPDGEFLDAVATFRKLELSFWWVVNMLEVGELLRWAATADTRHRRTPRRITFFAAIAEWKHIPEAAFTTELDTAPSSALLAIVIRAALGESNAAEELASLIEAKVKQTNDVNIDESGVLRLSDFLEGCNSGLHSAQSGGVHLIPLDTSVSLRKAAELMREAIDDPKLVDSNLTQVHSILNKVARELRVLALRPQNEPPN